jgi:hypothetical protein
MSKNAMTRPRFVAFHLLCGLAAALLQIKSEAKVKGRRAFVAEIDKPRLIRCPRANVRS